MKRFTFTHLGWIVTIWFCILVITLATSGCAGNYQPSPYAPSPAAQMNSAGQMLIMLDQGGYCRSCIAAGY